MAALAPPSTWTGPAGQPILDGTNNAGECAIIWWVKRCYRSMRDYQGKQSALNVSRLIAFYDNHLAQGLDLSSLVAEPRG